MNATDATMDTPHPLHERVELIVHLLKFSDRLFAIMSPARDELHAFSDQLIKEGGTELLFARVQPDATQDVAANLAKAWGIKLNLGESATQAIEQQLPELLRKYRRAVAIIEDAEEHLPPHILDQLIGFIQHLNGQTGGRARLVLLGGPNLASRLQQTKSLESGGQVYALHLTPPPAEAFADMPTSISDDDPSILERPVPRGSHSPALPGRALLIGSVVASLTLAVVIALLLRPNEPEVKKDQQISVPLKSETLANLPVAPLPSPPSKAIPSEPVVPSAPAPIGLQQTESVTDARGVNTPMASALPAPPISSPQPATSTPMEAKSSAPTPTMPRPSTQAAKPAVELKPGTPAAKPMAEPKSSLPAPKPPAQPTQKASNWYAQQKGEQYVLQVVSLKSEAEIERFISQHGLKGCHSFRQLHNGQTLYTLTCGLYPSRIAASEASARLPEKVQASKPFPRRIDDIRKIMQP